MDPADLTLLRDGLEHVVGATPAERLPAELDEFGWPDLLASDPSVAVGVLFELQGRHRTASTTLDVVAARAAGVDAGAVAVVYPSLPSEEPTSTVAAVASGVQVEIGGVVASRARAPEVVLVPARLDGVPVLAQLPWRGSWPSAGSGIDPEGPWTTLTAGADEAVLFTGSTGARRWQRLRAATHRAVAHELYGAGTAMLDLAVAHVGSRTQFGRTLGSFQAVKHKLADVRLWQECASLALAAAWEPATTDETSTAGVLAKLVASRFTRLARDHCQQVLGGMGFTWEHDFHRYVRRVLVLEELLGSTERLHAWLGSDIRANGLHPQLASLSRGP